MSESLNLVLYSKPGCHLCEGLQEKLAAIDTLNLNLEIRDITTQDSWFERYQYEIPVLCLIYNAQEYSLPRFSPRTSVAKITEILTQRYQQVRNSE